MKKKTPGGGQPLYRVKSGYVLREIAGEYLAIPVSLQDGPESRIAIFNESGGFLWEQLQQSRSFAQLVTAMAGQYNVSAEEAGADIHEFLERLRTDQLLLCENGG